MVCLMLFGAAAAAQQLRLGAHPGINARNFKGQVGRRLTFICPATKAQSDYVWGTDIYTDDSMICPAAIHAGVLQADTAGLVNIVMGAGFASFQGSSRNGVTSKNYGPWDSTYTFSRASEPGQIDWNTTALYVPAEYRDPVNVVCPSGGNLETIIWGTDIYSASSSICVAAVHAGAVTRDTGGKVTVTKMPPQETLVATSRNGVSSRGWTGGNYRDYPDPFRVTPYTITANVPASPGARSGPIPVPTNLSRVIDLPGITAAGTSTTVSPRTIDLPGVTAAGTSTTASPRTIDLPGITAVGTSATVPSRTIDLPGITAAGTFATAASRTITLAGFSGSGVPPTAASRTIVLNGFTGSGVPVTAALRSIVLVGWTGSGR